MSARRYREMSLRLLGGALGLSTTVLAVGGLCTLILDHDAGRLSPWLDPRALSNWLVLCGASVAGLGCILLAERSAGPVPATAPADAPAATTAAMAPGDRGRIGSPPPAEALPADRLRHAA